MSLHNIDANRSLTDRDQALFDELLCIADSKFILGNWYLIALPNGRSVPDWSALCAMMQDHYGHARALYRYLARFGFTREEAEWHRPAESIRSMRTLDEPPQSWSDFVVTGHLGELAVASQLEAIAQSEVDPQLARLAAKIGTETCFHLSYFEGWREVLVKGLEHAVQASLTKRLPETLEWWGPCGAPDPLHDAGWRKQANVSLRARFRTEIEKTYSSLRFPPEADDHGAVTSHWELSTRRTGRPGIPARLHELIRFKEPEIAVP